MHDVQFSNVVEQGFDWSCGVASLTTLLREGFGDVVSESDLVEEIQNVFSKKTQDRGLSIAELVEVARNRGYSILTKQITADQLKNIGLPVIVKIELYDGGHFVILKGNGIVQTERMTYAVIVDPAGGNRRIPFYQFQHQWLGNATHATAVLIQRRDLLWKENSSLFVLSK